MSSVDIVYKIDDNDIRKIIQGATSILLRENGNNPYLIHEELQKNMQYNVGIIRTKKWNWKWN
mgnify:CR=1 FL=1